MAFRKKAVRILEHTPDILVVPECEHPEKLLLKEFPVAPSDYFWFGNNKHKGLGVFAFSGYRLKLHTNHQPEFKIILPLMVSGGKTDFNLLAVWANNPADPKYQYIGQVWKALHHYTNLLGAEKVILAGDFNSNTFWDKPKRKWNHTDVVALLNQHDIQSTYHRFFKLRQGKEKHPTHFLYRHKDKPYHLDYCFASAHFVNRLTNVTVGSHHKWNKYSDHTPVISTFLI